MLVAALGFGELAWSLLILFLIVQYLIITFSVVVDVFRSEDLSGVGKVAWLVGLLVFPLLTLLAYVLIRGHGMRAREVAQARKVQETADAYIREVAGTGGPASELRTAKGLLDEGVIDVDEFERLKARVLA
ncbi:MAG: SHOCT domain-containing protein [Acidimicrobiia bacterium]